MTATLLPGRERRFGETMYRSMDQAADGLVSSIEHIWRSGHPHVLFGHSLGGLLAFEVARRLEHRDLAPARVVISGATPVPRGWERYEWDDESLVEMIEELGGTPSEVLQYPDLLRLCVQVLRADLRLVDTYSTAGRAPIRTPITALGGSEDPNVDPADLAEWAKFTSSCETKVFPGGHFYLEEDPASVLRWLHRHLALAST